MKRMISSTTLQGNWKKTAEHESDNHINLIGALGTVTEGLIKGLQDLEISERVETI